MLLPRTACGNLAQQKFLEKLHQISCNETENKANFHFSRYNSTETLSCHSNHVYMQQQEEKKTIIL